MALHPDKLANLARIQRQRLTTNPRPVAPIARPRPAAPQGYNPLQRRRIEAKRQISERQPHPAQQRQPQVTKPAEPTRERPGQARPSPTGTRQRRQAVLQRERGRKQKLLPGTPEPGLLQRLAYRMHEGRLSRHFADLQERRKEIGFRKV